MQNKLYSLLLLLFFSVVPVLAQTDVVDDEDNDTTLVADSAWVDSLIHRNDTLAWPKNGGDRAIAQERDVQDIASRNHDLRPRCRFSHIQAQRETVDAPSLDDEDHYRHHRA